MEKTIERRTDVTLGKKNIRTDMKVTEEYLEEYFPIVKASTLSLEDDFLKHEPETEEQRSLKNRIIAQIEFEVKYGSGCLPDFRAQRMDPTLDEKGEILYQAGKKPAVGKSAIWWTKKAKEFMPQKESRLGTIKERCFFLGLLIKYLIEEGYEVSEAWKMVCDQSKDLGHYQDSQNAKHEYESTGSRKIGPWYDLANTSKLAWSRFHNYALLGGFYIFNGDEVPLSYFSENIIGDSDMYGSFVGWIVLSV